jgi:hypothetical protein
MAQFANLSSPRRFISRRVTPEEVVAAWGPADSLGGSGIMEYLYTMGDGTPVALIYEDGYIVSPRGSRRSARPN